MSKDPTHEPRAGLMGDALDFLKQAHEADAIVIRAMSKEDVEHESNREAMKTFHARAALIARMESSAQPPPVEPAVLGAGCGVRPMPTVVEAIEAHVRQIEILCDAANIDPTQWLQDEVTQ